MREEGERRRAETLHLPHNQHRTDRKKKKTISSRDFFQRRSVKNLSTASSVELLLLVRRDRAVGRRVRHARQHEALADLVVVEEGLVRLVDAARDDLARARRARARAARVGEVDAGLLCGVEDVRVVFRFCLRREGEEGGGGGVGGREKERGRKKRSTDQPQVLCRSRRTSPLLALRRRRRRR